MQDIVEFLNHYVLPTESLELIFTFSLYDVPDPDDKQDYFLFVEGGFTRRLPLSVPK